MQNPMSKSRVLETSLGSVSRSLNAGAARKLLALRANDALQQRIDELGALCNEGTASGEELAEYDAMIGAANLIGILQAQARKRLANKANGD